MSRTAPPHALVVGLGASGVAAAKLLHHQGWRVTINDRARRADLEARLAELPTGVLRSLGGHNPSLLTGTARVVVSPGVPWDLPLLVEARRRHIEVMAEVELAARELAGTPIVGVTGSNGKTTVTSLVGEMLRCAGRRVGVGGNIGTAACDLALAGGWDAVVLELSSFQLEACASLRPRVAILLNVSADHLDRHSGMNAYLAAKRRIFAKQCADDWAVLNADDPGVARLAVPAQVVRFSLVDPTAAAHLAGGALVLDGTKLLPRREVALLGDHNIANALAAALAAERLGDDSKGTNIGATAAGLAGYPPESVHLILGGLGKGQDFTALRPALAGRVAQVYLIGAAADEIAAALEGHVALERCDTLEVAVGRAAAQAQDGDTVLLSPACASFDQFDDYAHRGDEFASLAREWAGSEERDGIGSQRAAGARRSLSRRKGGGSGDVPPRED
jgi:UDP-N-acetylmuramoylalanine--D-glutamate ligase